jgi:hypothetical protein
MYYSEMFSILTVQFGGISGLIGLREYQKNDRFCGIGYYAPLMSMCKDCK